MRIKLELNQANNSKDQDPRHSSFGLDYDSHPSCMLRPPIEKPVEYIRLEARVGWARSAVDMSTVALDSLLVIIAILGSCVSHRL